MAASKLVVYIDSSDPSRVLTNSTQIVFIITSRNEDVTKNLPVAWKVWSFYANADLCMERHQASLPVGYSIDLPVIVDSTIVGTHGGSASIGADQYLSLSEDMRWSSNRLTGVPFGHIVAINNSNFKQTITLGAVSHSNRHEPLVLLRELESHAGLLFAVPSVLRAYAMPACVVGHVFSHSEWQQMVDKSIIEPIDLSDTEAAQDLCWKLYTSEEGQPVLERTKVDMKPADEVSLPPSPTGSAVSFADALKTPPATPLPALNSIPGIISPPPFLHPLWTPPSTPQPELPGTPPFAETPMFLTPLQTPHTTPLPTPHMTSIAQLW